ncbi:MAG: hypothetical protein JF609_02395, partial [Verrucomicrobia bacterium]|nr:hypothetical protein [Verrucomicrobiota bacterium]
MQVVRHFIISLAAISAWWSAGYPAKGAPSFQKVGNTLIMSNVNVRLEYNLAAGTTDFYWKNSKKISAFYSGIGFDSGYVKGTSYSAWNYLVQGSNQVTVTASGNGVPTMKQHFILDQPDSFLVSVEAAGTNLSANWMGPVVVDTAGGVDIGITNDNRALVVPFDNDGFVRYNAAAMNSSATGYEVAAFYDNTSRNGLVVGSVTHDTWKTGVFFNGARNKLSLMNVYGGATSPWDVLPHGYVTGNSISSPTMFVGFGDDWRVTMQNYAAENTNMVARLPWTNGIPFGWNSWGVIQQNISYADALAVSDFFHTNLQPAGFSNGGTAYINLDSYWDNLNSFQLQSFVNRCHANGQKAGIYFGPFVFFGSASDATNWFMEGTTNTYHFADALLRDGSGNFQSTDGGLALDPTHPGTRQRITYYINLFTNYGFDFVKLDFLSHGALEGGHYDTNITTGIQAYNQGMQFTLDKINGRMFVSESIAPLFPYQYGHSRRVACDAETSFISNTEYTMNSVTYGWWLGTLYQFNDPDIMVFGNGQTANEQQSRLINAAVTGVFLNGDDLTQAAGQQAAQACLTNAAINNVARSGQTFTPVEGNTGSSAANIFVRPDGTGWLVAVFNYGSSSANVSVDLVRAGLPATNYLTANLWDGTTASATNVLNVSLGAKQAKLYRLSTRVPGSLVWKNGSNSGAWDAGTSANWVNASNSFTMTFNNGDRVLFDDTMGVPATVSVNGTVAPAGLVVNASTNIFTIGGTGTISGTGGLVKMGSSPLTLLAAGNFTGPVIVGSGSVYAGNNCLHSASGITVSNGATLDLGGGTYNTGQPLTVSGAGVNRQGALINSYNNYPLEVFTFNLAGDAVFGGNARWDLGSGSGITGAHGLTLDWSADTNNAYGEWTTVSIGANVTGITLTNGSKLGAKNMDNAFQNPATPLTIGTNSQLIFWSGGWNGSLRLQSGAQAYLWTAPAAFNGSSIVLEDNAQWQSWGGSGNEPINSTVILNGVVHMV